MKDIRNNIPDNTLAELMDQKLNHIKSLTLGIDEDMHGNAIFYTMENEQMKQIKHEMEFFGLNHPLLSNWDYVTKFVGTVNGEIEVYEWTSNFPLKQYEADIYNYYKQHDKDKAIKPMWIRRETETIKTVMTDLLDCCYGMDFLCIEGTSMYIFIDKMIELIRKYNHRVQKEDLERYEASKYIPSTVIRHTFDLMLNMIDKNYHTTYCNNEDWGEQKGFVINTNFPFNYTYDLIFKITDHETDN